MSKRAKKRAQNKAHSHLSGQGNLRPVKILDRTGKVLSDKSTDDKESTPSSSIKPNQNYPSGETKDKIAERQQLLKVAAEHLILYLENKALENGEACISYIDFYHTFKLEEKHIWGLQNLLIKTSPENRRWLIVQYDEYNLPILSIIRSINKPDNYNGPNLPSNYDKAMPYLNAPGLNGGSVVPANTPSVNGATLNGTGLNVTGLNGASDNARTVAPLTVLEVPDDRPVKLPPKPRKDTPVEEKLITYIEHECPNQTISLFDVSQHVKGWDYSVPMLNKRVKKYGIELVENGDFMLSINRIPVNLGKSRR